MPAKYNYSKFSLTALGAIALPAILLDPASGFKQNYISGFESNRTLISQSTSDAATISPFASRVIINEVLYQQTGTGATGNDEFIEIYNSSATSVDLSGWKVVDGNLIGASNDGIGSITGRSNNPAYTFPENTVLEPGKFAIVWIGSNNSSHQAPKAAFQFWLEQLPKLNNEGDDVWLYDRESRIVDYIAYGSGTAINTPPPASLNLWDSSDRASLANATKGQSIALATNGVDTNTSACWEATGSKAATDRCQAYSPSIDTDETSDRATSVAQKNTSTPVPTPTPTPTPSVTPTPTLTPLPRVTPTSTPTPIPTLSPTPTPSITPTAIPTLSPTPTPSITPTIAPVNRVNGIIREPKDPKKAIICHVPPGNAGNPVTLSINLNAIAGHSNHPNDYDGPCRLK